MALVPSIKLNDGNLMPQLGLGTFESKPNEVSEAVKAAIAAGYRHIDCARYYQNESEVGAGIKAKILDGTVRRDELFITSKLWCTSHRPEKVLPALKATLNDLGVDFVDMYLVHWPVALKAGDELLPKDENGLIMDNETDHIKTWKEMEKVVKLGFAKSIGLSNFNSKQIANVLQNCTIPPANLQVELHPYFQQRKLVEFCKERHIVVTCYSPFGNPTRPVKSGDAKLLENPKLVEIGKKYGKGANHVILRWMLQMGVVGIPKSVTASRIQDNLKIMDFKLSNEDIEAISNLDKGQDGRQLEVPFFKASKEFPFADAF